MTAGHLSGGRGATTALRVLAFGARSGTGVVACGGLAVKGCWEAPNEAIASSRRLLEPTKDRAGAKGEGPPVGPAGAALDLSPALWGRITGAGGAA